MSSRAIDLRLAAVVVLAAAVTACGGGGGAASSPQPAAPPPIVVTNTFPPNVAAPSGGGTAWDITQVTTTLTSVNPDSGSLYDTLRIDMTFQQDISNALPAPGTMLSKGSQLGVATAFDPAGNAQGAIQGCAPAGTTPFTYATDEGDVLGRLLDGNYALLNQNGPVYTRTNTGGVSGLEALTSAAGHVLTQVYKLSAVGVVNLQVPKLKVQFIVFNGLGRGPTECVPLDDSEIAVAGS